MFISGWYSACVELKVQSEVNMFGTFSPDIDFPPWFCGTLLGNMSFLCFRSCFDWIKGL